MLGSLYYLEKIYFLEKLPSIEVSYYIVISLKFLFQAWFFHAYI